MCHFVINFQRLVVAAVLFSLCLGTARAQVVEIVLGSALGDITAELRYWGAVEPDLGTALRAYRDGAFGNDLRPQSLSAVYASETWAAVEIVNLAPGDGRAGDSFVMSADAPLMGGLRVFLVRETGLTENLLDYSIFTAFDPLEHAVTRLRTPAFTLAPDERVILLMNARLGPFPTFRISLHTPEDLAEASFVWGVGHTAFYAFSLSCLVFFFGFQAAMRSWVGVFSAALFLAFLGLIALVDGLLFRALYPQRPDLQSAIGFGLIFALSGLGFLVGGASLRAAQGRPSRASRMISAMALVSVAGFAVALAQPSPVTAQLAYALIVLMLLALVPGAVAARGDRVAPPVGAVTLANLAVLCALMVISLMVTGWAGAWLDAANALRGVFAFLLLATMTMLTANVIALRRRHLAAVQARVSALEAEAERSRELLEAERNYARARDLAAQRQRQLATASHDLKQPLMSLRMTFDTLAAGMAVDTRDRLDDAFDYLGSLATGFADEMQEEQAHTEEAYALSIPLATVQQMFKAEAAAKGLTLRLYMSGLTVTVPPIPLMRIVTNLVSNALKYSNAGRVVVGVRRGGGLRLCVIDTGPGMSADELARFRQAGEKGATSTGHGLGLSVCFELARAHGMTLGVASRPGRGTCFSLHLQGQPDVL